MPKDVIKELNAMCYKFIWKKDMESDTKIFDRVKRDVMTNNYEDGGIQMFDLEKHQHAFYLDWAERFLKDEVKEWKEIPMESLNYLGGKTAFEGEISWDKFKGIFSS